jgi:hypothetical protein
MRKVQLICLTLLLFSGCTATSPKQQTERATDPITVSTSPEGNHVNTVSRLGNGQWVIMAGTGGLFISEDTVIGIDEACFIVAFFGPTDREYSIEVNEPTTYFLAVFDNTDFQEGTDPESIILWLTEQYKEVDYCSGGMEIRRILHQENPSV